MNDKELQRLCRSLMMADSERDVISLLKNCGYWDDPKAWRYYGDYENNYNIIGNQQSRPDAALVEKLVNSVDARLMNECLVRGINPEGSDAPPSIQEAVALFFDNARKGRTSVAGRISDWPDSKRAEVARGITLAATGAKPGGGGPCFTIADCGEGQTPEQMPDTLLSLNRSNKLRIPFVQGRFNMGGTGVLKFCGQHNLQLVVSRRNPALHKEYREGDNSWAFTVVRREDPHGNRRSSVYTYLAPVGAICRPGEGGVLRFAADELPIFPEGRSAYARSAIWGTLIKLYEYSATGFQSHILMPDGLLGRIDLLLPDVALPMRFYECRDYAGHQGSFETTLAGVRVRLEDDKGRNLERGFPDGAPVRVAGEEMLVSVYAFKKKGIEAYRRNEGVIFVVSGQTHGHLTQDFFTRKKVGLSYLADSVLVLVDCTKLSGRAREDLFMNSRDRLSGGDLRSQIEECLEEFLRHHQGLRALKEQRRREEIESRLDQARPLEDILEKLLQQSPSLSNLFLRGGHASTPFKTVEAQSKDKVFGGKRFPTFFKFKDKVYGHELARDCHINMRCRLTFETDAENQYFSRSADPGEFTLLHVGDHEGQKVQDYILNLQNGIATLSLTLPWDVAVGQRLHYIAITNDSSRIEPFRNEFAITVKDAQETNGRGGKRRKPADKSTKGDRELPSGIELPQIRDVYEHEWAEKSPPFDKFTALRIKNAGDVDSEHDSEDAPGLYDFFVNMDNVYLKSELRSSKTEPDLVRAQFKYGVVLLGLAILQQDSVSSQQGTEGERRIENEDGDGESVEMRVEQLTRTVAPVVIPMISTLGSLTEEEGVTSGTSGEAT